MIFISWQMSRTVKLLESYTTTISINPDKKYAEFIDAPGNERTATTFVWDDSDERACLTLIGKLLLMENSIPVKILSPVPRSFELFTAASPDGSVVYIPTELNNIPVKVSFIPIDQTIEDGVVFELDTANPLESEGALGLLSNHIVTTRKLDRAPFAKWVDLGALPIGTTLKAKWQVITLPECEDYTYFRFMRKPGINALTIIVYSIMRIKPEEILLLLANATEDKTIIDSVTAAIAQKPKVLDFEAWRAKFGDKCPNTPVRLKDWDSVTEK